MKNAIKFIVIFIGVTLLFFTCKIFKSYMVHHFYSPEIDKQTDPYLIGILQGVLLGWAIGKWIK